MQIPITIANESTTMSDSDFAALVPVLQTQVSRDFAPEYGKDAQLTAVKGPPPAGAWALVALDDADQAGALGYHDLTVDGLPLGKFFVRTTLNDGGKPSVTGSHELLELLADSDINLSAQGGHFFYAYEIADACEDDQFGYDIDGVTVSDFVFRSWFESFRAAGSTQFDFQNKITKPFELLPGGYISVLSIRHSSGWQQITADKDPTTLRRARGHVGSRRERRRVEREMWQNSTYKAA